jgi:hypothetical protein
VEVVRVVHALSFPLVPIAFALRRTVRGEESRRHGSCVPI